MKNLKNSAIGKLLRRLLGEETGAVMMEYVILAVLIAAAAVVAIAYFGKNIVSEANTASTAMTGQGKEAADQAQATQNQQSSIQQEAVDVNKQFSTVAEDAQTL